MTEEEQALFDILTKPTWAQEVEIWRRNTGQGPSTRQRPPEVSGETPGLEHLHTEE